MYDYHSVEMSFILNKLSWQLIKEEETNPDGWEILVAVLGRQDMYGLPLFAVSWARKITAEITHMAGAFH